MKETGTLRAERVSGKDMPMTRAPAAALGLLLVAAATAAEEPQKSSIVYYQVTYADGSVKDLDNPPGTREGVRRVMRIARYSGGTRGHQVLATGSTPITITNPTRTYRNDLRWDAKLEAWVAPQREDADEKPASSTRPAVEDEAQKRIRALLQTKTEELAELEGEIAEFSADAESDPAGGTETAKKLKRLRARRSALIEVVREYARLTGQLEGDAPDAAASPRPREVETVGEVAVKRACPLKRGAGGVLKPLRARRVLPHRVQVWKLPPARGERTYRVSIAHAEAGRYGAFHYVAYADTDGDGVPDAPLATSPLAVASRPGDWSVWEFRTDRPVVFVGNTWPDRRASLYCAEAGDRVRNWAGLAANVFIARDFHGTPKWKAHPYLTNLRVRVVGR